jgi:hypothetical protein
LFSPPDSTWTAPRTPQWRAPLRSEGRAQEAIYRSRIVRHRDLRSPSGGVRSDLEELLQEFRAGPGSQHGIQRQAGSRQFTDRSRAKVADPRIQHELAPMSVPSLDRGLVTNVPLASDSHPSEATLS